MKIRSSTKIAVGFVALAAAAYFGYNYYSAVQVDRIVFPPIKPGKVNIVGINTGAGYRILVANNLAQLIESSGGEEMEQGERDFNSEGDSGGEKKRVPLKEVLEVLQGREESLSDLIRSMNESLRNAELPPMMDGLIWKAEDIQKALDGDKTLERELIKDLNVQLDGTPASFLNKRALEEGIVIDAPVPVDVMVGGEKKKLIGRVLTPYKPRFADAVYKRFREKFEQSDSVIQGLYSEEAKLIEADPKLKENVRKALEARMDAQTLKQYGEGPSKILGNAEIILNDSMIEKAEFREKSIGDGKESFDIVLDLTDEGRKRLWQYSRRKPGSQLLFIENGIAIAAPRVRHDLAYSQQTITQIPDRGLVEETVELINQLAAERKK